MTQGYKLWCKSRKSGIIKSLRSLTSNLLRKLQTAVISTIPIAIGRGEICSLSVRFPVRLDRPGGLSHTSLPMTDLSFISSTPPHGWSRTPPLWGWENIRAMLFLYFNICFEKRISPPEGGVHWPIEMSVRGRWCFYIVSISYYT